MNAKSIRILKEKVKKAGFQTTKKGWRRLKKAFQGNPKLDVGEFLVALARQDAIEVFRRMTPEEQAAMIEKAQPRPEETER